MRFETFEEWLAYAPTALSLIIPVLMMSIVGLFIIFVIAAQIWRNPPELHPIKSFNRLIDRCSDWFYYKKEMKAYKNRFVFKRPNIFIRLIRAIIWGIEDFFVFIWDILVKIFKALFT